MRCSYALCQVRQKYHIEGCVLYYVHGQAFNTIGLCKLKTTWYVVLRALREKTVWGMVKMDKDPSFVIGDLKKSFTKRLTEIQNWLKFTTACFNKWLVSGQELVLIVRNKFLGIILVTITRIESFNKYFAV